MPLSQIQTLDNQIIPNLGRRNIVINGDMSINQRYESTALTRTNQGGYGLDRYELAQVGTTGSPSSKVERVADAPSGSGFYYSQKVTVVSAASGYAATDHNLLQTKFEGLNTKHLLWGTSDAKTCTVSFWVKSSVTGAFSYYILDGDASGGANYIAPFTISAADTWEKKTITIPGPTSGGVSEFPVNNGRSLYTGWNLGVGTNHQNSTTNAWVYGTSTWANSTSSTVKLMDTVNATFQVTGHQFEIGNVATDFEHRSFAEELAACQRYYYQCGFLASTYYGGGSGFAYTFNATESGGSNNFPVTMRSSPTVRTKDAAGNIGGVHRAGIGDVTSGVSVNWSGNADANTKGIGGMNKSNAWASGNCLIFGYEADAEL